MSPKLAQSIYQLGTVVPAILGLLLIWGGIDQGAADNIGQIVSGLVSLFGSAAPAVAAKRVSDQRKDGTFEATAPVDAVINGVQAVLEAKATAEATVKAAQAEVDKVKNAVTEIASIAPKLGPLAASILS